MPTLLVIDDNVTNLKVAVECLQAGQFEILTARSGEVGLARAQETLPDLILLDIQMPSLTGWEVCHRLKAEPRTASIPVIFMTALSDVEDKVRGFQAGAVDYVTKPLEAAELLARVNTHLQLSGLQQQLAALVRELEARNRELALLRGLSEAVHGCATAEEAHALLPDFLAKLFPAASGALYWRTLPNQFSAVAAWGQAPLTTTETWPILAEDEKLGWLAVSAPLSLTQYQLARAVAEQLALGLINLSLREQLRQQAIRDPLTGQFNRRYLEETLAREVARAAREQTPLSVVMLDIDHFKRFNDTYGHEAGDDVLRAAGAFLSTHVRREDVVCRYGGEEFTLILPGVPLAVAVQRAELVRGAAQHLQVQARGQALPAITLSLGVATFPQHGQLGPNLLQAADAALYQAKQKGRNQVAAA